jgi:hypothetical protein
MADANIDIVIDCADPETLAEFWAEALAYDKVGLFDNYCVLLARNRELPPIRPFGRPRPDVGSSVDGTHRDNRKPREGRSTLSLGDELDQPWTRRYVR